VKKNLFVFALAAVLLPGVVFVGCGRDAATPDCSKPRALKIGATPTPHGEILKFIAPRLKEKGIDLEIKEFTDYVLPNMALQNKELDANYFQHAPYLEDFNKKNGTRLSAVMAVHFEPLGLYSGKSRSLSDLKNGSVIAVPNDTTNEARALLLLEAAGMIKVNPHAGLKATAKDIIDNPKKLAVKELEAAQIARSLPDVDFAVINGNYAIEAKLSVEKDALKSESKESLAAKTFANIIVVRSGEENRKDIGILKEVMGTQEVRDFISRKYQGAVVPAF
jgi:D-methionine transport system substrate-binding protein